MEKSIEIVQGKFGKKAIVKAKWEDDFLNTILESNVKELELNTGKGWSGDNLNFLERLSQLESFILIDQKINDISGINFLHELRFINISAYTKSIINFNLMYKLENCFLEWNKGFESIFNCYQLVHFGVNRLKLDNDGLFSNFKNLEKLIILNSNLTDLNRIYDLKKLKSLSLGNLRYLKSIEGIESLENLEALEIIKCKHLSDVTKIFELRKLVKLHLIDCGDINSFRCIENLSNLEELMFYESTNILDGNLSMIKNLKKLSKIAFQDRRHYTNKLEDFDKS